MQPNRRARLESFIHEEVSQIVLREIKDPRIPDITFTKVVVSKDGRYATLHVLIFGQKPDDPDKDAKMAACIEGLNSAAGFMKRKLAKSLSMKNIPNLIFREDKGLDNTMRVHEILKKIDAEKK